MEIIRILHLGFTNMAVLFFLVLGVWGLYRALRGRAVDGNYMGALVIAQILLVVNILVGGLLWLNGGAAGMGRPSVHYLYGAFALIFLPFVYAVMLRGDDSNRAQFVWGFVGLFMFFLIPRFSATGL